MITFRTSSTLQNLTERPLRFAFNDKRKCLALIDSYSTRILIIDYMDFVSCYRATPSIGAYKLEIFVLECINNQSFIFTTDKLTLHKIIELNAPPNIDKPYLEINSTHTELLLTAQKLSSKSSFTILASSSKYDEHIEKIAQIINLK